MQYCCNRSRWIAQGEGRLTAVHEVDGIKRWAVTEEVIPSGQEVVGWTVYILRIKTQSSQGQQEWRAVKVLVVQWFGSDALLVWNLPAAHQLRGGADLGFHIGLQSAKLKSNVFIFTLLKINTFKWILIGKKVNNNNNNNNTLDFIIICDG